MSENYLQTKVTGTTGDTSTGYTIFTIFIVKNRLNTVTAIEMAKKRHIFMEQFLE